MSTIVLAVVFTAIYVAGCSAWLLIVARRVGSSPDSVVRTADDDHAQHCYSAYCIPCNS